MAGCRWGYLWVVALCCGAGMAQGAPPWLKSTAHAIPKETTTEGSGYFSILEGQDRRIYIGAAKYGFNAYLVGFDPKTQKMSIAVDCMREIGSTAQGFAAQAKIHTRNNLGESGRLYFGTKQGYPKEGEQRSDYPGGYPMVYDPATGTGGDGAFHPNSNFRDARFSDGLSKTLCIAEVKSFTPYVRNTSEPASFPAGSPPSDPASISGLTSGGDARISGTTNDCTGHTEWPDGRVHHAGFTTVFPPNTRVPHTVGGITHDFDFNSRQEGSSATQKTFAAITSRSHHKGLVTVSMLDGSTKAVNDEIDGAVWRALGTRAGGETAAAE